MMMDFMLKMMMDLIKAEASRRETDIISIAQGRSTWAADLPKFEEDHELTESQMNFLLRINPEVGLLGGAKRFHVLQTIGGKCRFLLSADLTEASSEEDDEELPSPIAIVSSFVEDDEEGGEEAALREALALSMGVDAEPEREKPEEADGKHPSPPPNNHRSTKIYEDP